MQRYLKWAFQPVVLIIVSVVLVAAAGVIVLPLETSAARPQPLPVGADEQEVAWLYPATSTTTWDRLVAAVHQAHERLVGEVPGLLCEQQTAGSSAQTVPQVALIWPESGRRRRIVFRWYKLTSQWSPQTWIEALLARRPPPLAVIGGNNSHWARELAVQLERASRRLPASHRPLLLITTATADRVPRPTKDDAAVELPPLEWNSDRRTLQLLRLYPGRTFRFCFTNRQMATAVTRFIWTRQELRPDSDPACLVQWTDDAYSQDLLFGYRQVLARRAAETFLQQWGFVTGCVGLRLSPLGLPGWYTSSFGSQEGGTLPLDVDSSVGSFSSPNPYEAKVVRELLRELQPPPGSPRPAPRQPLLVLTGQQQASRRFLRDLARTAPDLARRLVVAMGDALSFNTIYRDGRITWPVQDLPFTLVFFAHRNPIDPTAGFRHDDGPWGRRTWPSGTEDLLLFRDIVEAVVLALRGGPDGGRPTADSLAEGLMAVQLDGDRLTRGPGGVPLFGPRGQRNDATGEHVIYLQPQVRRGRVLPEAVIEVWSRQSRPAEGGEAQVRDWEPRGEPLIVTYDESEVYHARRRSDSRKHGN